jgi:SAM-dependent methyltransferase
MSGFHIVLVSPQGYPHIDCLSEMVEALEFSLRALGHEVSVARNRFESGKTNILLGSHLLTPELAGAIPAGSILYNLEQLGSAPLSPIFFAAALEHRVWDYSPLNLERWAAFPLRYAPKLLEPGYVPELRRIDQAPVLDIDVLFYGSINPRRATILRALRDRGLAVHHAFGVYGRERDALIARARVVLNMHFYDTQLFEIVRVAYLLNNGKAVVTESSPDLGEEIAGCVLACSYEELVEQTVALLNNEPRRQALEKHGGWGFQKRKQVDGLMRVLEQIEESDNRGRTAWTFPRRINLGSGKDWRADYLNIDINDYWRPDAVLDIAQPQPVVIELETERFGTVQLSEGCLDEIVANDVLEHIPDLARAMTTALRLLRDGGQFRIQVPYDLSWGAWQDPTHLRAFNERSWLYYTEWFWYMGWTESRFTIGKLEFVLSPIGDRLREQQLQSEDLVRSPRAVDSMKVVLVKQPLTAEEKRLVERYRQRPELRVGVEEQVGEAVAIG